MVTTGSSAATPFVGGVGADPQVRVSVLTAAGSALVGGAAAALGGLVSGSGAALGALLGAGLAVGIFVGGALFVYVASLVLPSISLVVALLTYACQVAVALMVFQGLTRTHWLEDGTVSGPWLGAVLTACALVWTGVQVRVAATTRVPLYDLEDAGAR